MRHKLVRTAAFGGIVVLGLSSAQAAMAGPSVPEHLAVPCHTWALDWAISHATDGSVLTLAPTCTYWLDEALPDINTDLTIIGAGSTLRRAHDAPDFSILGVGSGDVSITGVSFVNGGGPDEEYGGAIYNDGGNVSVNGGTFQDNETYYEGGAIYNESGTLTVTSATFLDNTSEYGGAIGNEDAATIKGGKFIGNHAVYYEQGDAEGGAVYNDDHIRIGLATFSGNSSEDGGGAFYNDESSTASLVYDTMSRNSAYQGGGIYNYESETSVAASSITNNRASDSGGGIYSYDSTVYLAGDFIHANEPNNCTPSIAGCHD